MTDPDWLSIEDYYAGEEPENAIWLTGEDREIISSG